MFHILKHIGKLAWNIKESFLFLCILFVPVFGLKAQTLEQLFHEEAYKEMVEKYGAGFRDLGLKELILLSTAYDRIDNKEEQVKVLEQILRIKPKYFKAHYQLAEVSKEIAYGRIKSGKQYENYEDYLNKMMENYKAAIQIEPRNVLPYRGMMSVIKDQENVNEGIALSKEMIKIFKETPETIMNLCYWNSKFGLVEQTRSACQKASELNPDNAEPLVFVARTYQDSGEKEKYEKMMLDLFKRYPNDTEVIQRVGMIYYDNKDFYHAEKVLKRNSDPQRELSLVYLGQSYFQNEKYNDALGLLNSSCENLEDHKKDLLRFYEGNLRRLEQNEDQGLRFKFQRAINNCKTFIAKEKEIRVRAGHFERGIRLPNSARSLSGSTIREKRESYEQQMRKGNEFKPSTGASKQMSGQ
ncbi:MAG: hypothetical protein M9899_01570 [Bdellovibrionaceae bacterium]|nr:hypothetical protein [Pseudobdellovibrionaceae bacterium]